MAVTYNVVVHNKPNEDAEGVDGSLAKAIKDAVSSNTLDELALTWDPITGSVIAIVITT